VTVGDLSERELIARIQRQLPPAPAWLTLGIGDDAAVIEPERNHLDVLTVDAVVEGVHFDRRFTPPEAIGHRALAVNLSDLAAMGARPRAALLSMMLPAALPSDDFDAIVTGLMRLAADTPIHVAGGNLTRTPGPLVVDVTVTGTVKRRKVLRRSGASAGDDIYVTGAIGAAAAGLQALQQDAADESLSSCVHRYLYPQPRVRAGLLIGRTRAASACMDLSDGLADGLRQITASSGVGAVVWADQIPVEPPALEWFRRHDQDPVIAAMSGGDDYELLLTASRRARRRIHAAARLAGVPLTRIGSCTAEPALALLTTADGAAHPASFPAGFGHFR
jgi:thiamine-monophosphate kinase